MKSERSNRVIGHVFLLADYRYVIADITVTDVDGVEDYIESCRDLNVSEKQIINSIKVQIEGKNIPLYKLQNIC